MEQAVSYRELWHETETNPVRIRGGEVGARVRKERVDGVPRKKNRRRVRKTGFRDTRGSVSLLAASNALSEFMQISRRTKGDGGGHESQKP
jgi:hypothetical protein